MGGSETIAKGIAALSRQALRSIFHRDAANFPGKIGLALDGNIIAQTASTLRCGSICVVGTNGKTTTTNLIACAMEKAGYSVCCNRTGANLDSGIASALLENPNAQWGVLECDELWLKKVLPQLQSNYVVLLNLFRDQLDRSGEIDLVQDSIITALRRSPNTTLIYNADDPLCTAIATQVQNKTIAFGIQEDMHLPQNSVTDSHLCQKCSSPLEYSYRQYGQLGNYHCPHCGFKRPTLDYAVTDVHFADDGIRLRLISGQSGDSQFYETELPGAYTVYNIAAAAIAASILECPAICIQQAISDYAPLNGRLERLQIEDHDVLVNLAKNPTGMNQSLHIALNNTNPFVLGLFINDKEADGHDVSWLWDVDFDELSSRTDVTVFVGGLRRYDMQVRLKYAGISSYVIDDASELIAQASVLRPGCPVYAIANYTALPAVRYALERLVTNQAVTPKANPKVLETSGQMPSINPEAEANQQPVVIAHLFPKLLNLYGDNGNITILTKRLQWRGIPVELRNINEDEEFDLTDVDCIFLGGAPDREQEIASEIIMKHAKKLHTFVENNGTCLAICGGYQMLGRSWLLNGISVPGVGLGAFDTKRAGTSRDRLVGNIVLDVEGINQPVVGYENHAGRTFLDDDAMAFGRVVSKTGHGNNDKSRMDGFVYKNAIGTYLHGPLLSKNPELADLILQRTLRHWEQRCGAAAPVLEALDDSPELRANAYMAHQ